MSLDVTMSSDGRVLTLLLNQPKGNILDAAMLGAIDVALDAHRDDKGLKLVVFRGAGGNFSYGASVAEHRKEAAPAMLTQFHGTVRRIARYPVPVLALVEGRCLGGAFEVALVAHFVFATPNASFACPEIRLGVFPPVLAAVGALRVGGALCERLLLTGEALSAEEARSVGLVSRIVAADDPMTAVDDWYQEVLAPLSAYVLRQGVDITRRASGLDSALNGPLDEAERHYLEALLPSHDGNEGIEAYLDRRIPTWKDA